MLVVVMHKVAFYGAIYALVAKGEVMEEELHSHNQVEGITTLA